MVIEGAAGSWTDYLNFGTGFSVSFLFPLFLKESPMEVSGIPGREKVNAKAQAECNHAGSITDQ